MDYNTLIAPIIVAAVPLVVRYAKKLVGGTTWLIPIIASALGVAADTIAAYAFNVPVTPMVGAILGLAGVGLREVVHELTKPDEPKPPVPFARPRL
jgi:hypothetical protein